MNLIQKFYVLIFVRDNFKFLNFFEKNSIKKNFYFGYYGILN